MYADCLPDGPLNECTENVNAAVDDVGDAGDIAAVVDNSVGVVAADSVRHSRDYSQPAACRNK